jgi:hypothetical protein
MEDLEETGTIGIGEKAGSFYMRKIYHSFIIYRPMKSPLVGLDCFRPVVSGRSSKLAIVFPALASLVRRRLYGTHS